MEQLDQLREMRDAAWGRIKASPDYKLATSLDSLIADLENALDSTEAPENVADPNEGEPNAPEDNRFSPDTGGAESDAEIGNGVEKPFEADVIPPMNIAADAPQAGTGEVPEQPEEEEVDIADNSPAEQQEDDRNTEARPTDDDVMSELTQMIHAGFADEARDEPSETGDADASGDDDMDNERAEQDAIMQAMRALDEDLSRSGIGSPETDGDPEDDESR